MSDDGRMSRERWETLMVDDAAEMTVAEFDAGWHWCADFDGLLVGPGMGELASCHCTWDDPEITKRVNICREAERKLLDAISGEPIDRMPRQEGDDPVIVEVWL